MLNIRSISCEVHFGVNTRRKFQLLKDPTENIKRALHNRIELVILHVHIYRWDVTFDR